MILLHGFIKKPRRRPSVIWTSPEYASRDQGRPQERRRSHEHRSPILTLGHPLIHFWPRKAC